MANPIRLKRSSTSGAAPLAGNILDGELTYNTTDGVFHIKRGADVFEISGRGGKDSNIIPHSGLVAHTQ